MMLAILFFNIPKHFAPFSLCLSYSLPISLNHTLLGKEMTFSFYFHYYILPYKFIYNSVNDCKLQTPVRLHPCKTMYQTFGKYLPSPFIHFKILVKFAKFALGFITCKELAPQKSQFALVRVMMQYTWCIPYANYGLNWCWLRVIMVFSYRPLS